MGQCLNRQWKDHNFFTSGAVSALTDKNHAVVLQSCPACEESYHRSATYSTRVRVSSRAPSACLLLGMCCV